MHVQVDLKIAAAHKQIDFSLLLPLQTLQSGVYGVELPVTASLEGYLRIKTGRARETLWVTSTTDSLSRALVQGKLLS